MFKQDMAFNNLQWLICRKTQQNQTDNVDCYKSMKNFSPSF